MKRMSGLNAETVTDRKQLLIKFVIIFEIILITAIQLSLLHVFYQGAYSLSVYLGIGFTLLILTFLKKRAECGKIYMLRISIVLLLSVLMSVFLRPDYTVYRAEAVMKAEFSEYKEIVLKGISSSSDAVSLFTPYVYVFQITDEEGKRVYINFSAVYGTYSTPYILEE